ncbi:hypothetical protein HCG49_05320 [Arenibacter sp. 6A1]|nr:hypothetical protein [Arenibacter sp. 6A1]NKI25976.1 hypothetical protein [Arenibacter sp. 6A1]
MKLILLAKVVPDTFVALLPYVVAWNFLTNALGCLLKSFVLPSTGYHPTS